MIVKFEAVEFAEIARLADAQDYRFQITVESPEHVLRRNLSEVPRPDRTLHGFERSVLADALRAAEHQSVVDLLCRPLHPVGEPF